MINTDVVKNLIEQIRLKADACGDATKEQRARKGAYVDCLVMMKEALHKPDVSGALPDTYPDTEADGCVFCGKCGKMK